MNNLILPFSILVICGLASELFALEIKEGDFQVQVDSVVLDESFAQKSDAIAFAIDKYAECDFDCDVWIVNVTTLHGIIEIGASPPPPPVPIVLGGANTATTGGISTGGIIVHPRPPPPPLNAELYYSHSLTDDQNLLEPLPLDGALIPSPHGDRHPFFLQVIGDYSTAVTTCCAVGESELTVTLDPDRTKTVLVDLKEVGSASGNHIATVHIHDSEGMLVGDFTANFAANAIDPPPPPPPPLDGAIYAYQLNPDGTLLNPAQLEGAMLARGPVYFAWVGRNKVHFYCCKRDDVNHNPSITGSVFSIDLRQFPNGDGWWELYSDFRRPDNTVKQGNMAFFKIVDGDEPPPPPPPAKVTLDWTIPTEREDDTAMSVDELSHYVLEWGLQGNGFSYSRNIAPGSKNQAVIDGLAPSIWKFRLKAVDTTPDDPCPDPIPKDFPIYTCGGPLSSDYSEEIEADLR